MKSKAQRLALIRAAGYHASPRDFFAAFKGSQINPEIAGEEFMHGHSLRQAGKPCDCAACKQVTRA